MFSRKGSIFRFLLHDKHGRILKYRSNFHETRKLNYRIQKSSPILRLCVTFLNKLAFFTERSCYPLAQPPSWRTTPLSADWDYLFNTLAATLHIWRPSPPSVTRGCTMSSWQDPFNMVLIPIYSQLPFISGGRLFHPQLENVQRRREGSHITLGNTVI